VTGHVHTGFTDFVFAGLSAIIMLHILRIVAAQLSTNPSTANAGKVVGAFALAD
jgi:hypothetical protein